MKKFLLIASTIICANLQAMWLESKVKKMLPKQNYILSTFCQDPTTQKEISAEKKAKRRHSEPSYIPSTATSRTANNTVFSLDLSDIQQSSSESIITSCINDDNQSISSESIVIATKQFLADEEIVSLIEKSRLDEKSSAQDSEEEIFDMDMSYSGSTTGYSVSKQYMPSYRRRSISSQSQYYQTSKSTNLIRRKSSLELYYSSHKKNEFK